jgi:hypothetical protein
MVSHWIMEGIALGSLGLGNLHVPEEGATRTNQYIAWSIAAKTLRGICISDEQILACLPRMSEWISTLW